MRMHRRIVAALFLAVALPVAAQAQAGRPFRDAWFWGVKGGGVAHGAQNGDYTNSPLAGVEWLLTRTRGGLYVSFAQAFFDQQAQILNGPTPSDTGVRLVNARDLRRLDMALVGFPGNFTRFHPYVGIGFGFNMVAAAEPIGTYRNSDQALYVESRVQELKTAFQPMLLVGAQYRLPFVSVFAQGTASAMNEEFLLYTGRKVAATYELGIRYNIGSSIDRDR